jgi:hypothetical protein
MKAVCGLSHLNCLDKFCFKKVLRNVLYVLHYSASLYILLNFPKKVMTKITWHSLKNGHIIYDITVLSKCTIQYQIIKRKKR